MWVMMLGDIVGAPGRAAARAAIERARAAGRAEVVIANAENAAAGRGLTPALAEELFAAGVHAITLGDHVWDQRDLLPHLAKEPRILRPLNLPPGCPGAGAVVIDTPRGPLTVLSLLGRVFLPPVADCPFRAFDAYWAARPPRQGPVLVEIHAEATSEKIALGRHLDGRAAVVAGTHTHVQTADERLLPRGTAYITDLGMTGPSDSVLGRALGPVMKKFMTGMPAKFDIAEGPTVAEGVHVRLAPTGLAMEIERFREGGA
jgi:2',3'-cyclic-nucleotide 2'-phosphodiesterase